MRKLTEKLTIRPGKDPGDAGKAAAMIRSGRAVFGNPSGDLNWLTGKVPDPDDCWFYLGESSVIGTPVTYAKAGIGYSKRYKNSRGGLIPNLQVMSVSVPVAVPADAAVLLTAEVMRWIAGAFWDAADGCGYVFADIPEFAETGTVAAELVGWTLVNTRKVVGHNLCRYVGFPLVRPGAQDQD